MKSQRLIACYDQDTLSLLETVLNQNEIHYSIQYDLMMEEGGTVYVRMEDYEKSIAAIRNANLKLAEFSDDQIDLFKNLESSSKELPLIGHLPFGFRVLILILGVTGLAFATIIYSLKTVSKGELTGKSWCIENIYRTDGSIVQPPEQKAKLHMRGHCNNALQFRKSGALRFSLYATGQWTYLSYNKVEISEQGDFLNGTYNLSSNLAENQIVLKSESATLVLNKMKYSAAIFPIE